MNTHYDFTSYSDHQSPLHGIGYWMHPKCRHRGCDCVIHVHSTWTEDQTPNYCQAHLRPESKKGLFDKTLSLLGKRRKPSTNVANIRDINKRVSRQTEELQFVEEQEVKIKLHTHEDPKIELHDTPKPKLHTGNNQRQGSGQGLYRRNSRRRHA